jgi:peptidoglycan/LPS O-acetylase OafA/YrhL
MSTKRKLIYKDIDTLRFLAVVPIVLYCVFYLMNSYKDNVIFTLTGGFKYLKMASVEFFFFLSAFLLTSHALREYKYKSRFNLRHFYIRRLLKLSFPISVLFIFTFLILPWIMNVLQLHSYKDPNFYSNLLRFPTKSEIFSAEQILLIGASWILIIYIFYYFLLGLIFKLFHPKLKVISFLFIILGLLDRAYHVLTSTSFEFDPLAYLVPIGIGLFFGNFVRKEKRSIETLKEIPKGTNFIVYTISLTVIVGGYFLLKETYFSLAVPLIINFTFGFMIIDQTFGKNSLFKLRKLKKMSKGGRMSFGLITYTFIISVIMLISFESLEFDSTSITTQALFICLSLSLGIGLSYFSYQRIEKPIGSIRKEFKKV